MREPDYTMPSLARDEAFEGTAAISHLSALVEWSARGITICDAPHTMPRAKTDRLLLAVGWAAMTIERQVSALDELLTDMKAVEGRKA